MLPGDAISCKSPGVGIQNNLAGVGERSTEDFEWESIRPARGREIGADGDSGRRQPNSFLT